MKKLLTATIAFLVLLTCLCLLPRQAQAALEQGFYYSVTDGKASITQYNGTTGFVTIPSTLGGYPVTEIGYKAFYNNKGLVAVTIPGSVQTIRGAAFKECTSLTTVTIEEGVQTVGEEAFMRCTSLPAMTFPDSVQTIGDSAFQTCVNLTTLTLGEGLESIGYRAFFSCSSLGTVTIPDSVQTVGDSAFWSCTSLIALTIGDSVQTIGDSAFCGCDSLTSVTIPDSVQTIGDGVFSDCASLTGIWVAESNPNYSSDDRGVLFNKNKTQLIRAPGAISGSYTVPEGVQTIGDSAFYVCEKLTSVTIPNSVQTIDEDGFCLCAGLTDVYYAGTEEQWNTIEIGEGNESLLEATIHFEAETSDAVPGDLDGVEGISEDDAIYLLQAILMPDLFQVSQDVDFDGNGVVNEDDAIYLLQHVLMPDMFPL